MKGSTAPPPNLALTLKLSKDDPLPNTPAQEAIDAETFTLLNREADLYRYTVAFPEYAIRINRRLKKFAKETKNSKWKAYAKGCLETCDSYTAFAKAERSKLNIAPKDVNRIEMLRPADKPSMGDRLKKVVKEENRLEGAGAKPALSEKAKRKEREEIEAAQRKIDKAAKAREKKRRKTQRTVIGDAEYDEDVDVKKLGEDEVKEGFDWSDDENYDSESE